MGKYFKNFEKLISAVVDIMLAILVVLVLVVMAEAIYKIVTYVIPLTKVSDLSFLIEEIATLFILLEIILMLLRYVKEGHHIPVRYLILISITAILRELLLAQRKRTGDVVFGAGDFSADFCFTSIREVEIFFIAPKISEK